MIKIERIRCEHYLVPLGIQEATPRLSWRFSGNDTNWTQAGYEIRILRRSSGVADTVIRFNSSESVLVPWPANPLKSRESAQIEVHCWGTDGTATSSSSIHIEAGLLHEEDWRAGPITCELQDANGPQRPFRLRTCFEAPARFTTARLYISALGLYEPHVNGRRVGSEYLAPGWTSYHNRLVYRTHDLTSLIRPGETNCLGAWVGEGWYCGRLAFSGGKRSNYGQRPALIAQLFLDDQLIRFTGDGNWSWSYGELISSELLNGEVYDGRLFDPNWCTSETKNVWLDAEPLEPLSTKLVASQSPPVQVVKTIVATGILKTPSGKMVIDFGQNFGGIVRIVGSPPADSKEIILRHAEVMEHGELGVRPLRHAAATERIILGQSSIVGYEPKFTSHGFRYVEVSGWEGVKASDLVGLVLQSAMERIGHFNCSHPLLNQLHENVVWSTVSNTIALPTDCPQRDERLGWTGDIQVFCPTMSYLFDTTGFLSGWLEDLHHDQRALGDNVPVTIPDILSDLLNRPLAIWGDAAVLTPLDLFKASGDIEILRRQYESARSWLVDGVVRDDRTQLWDNNTLQLSDWLAPKAPPEDSGDAPSDSILVADAYLVHTTRSMAALCTLLGKQSEAETYATQAKSLWEHFSNEYFTPNGRVMSDTQTTIALLLRFGIFPPVKNGSTSKPIANYRDRLDRLVTRANWVVDTGFAGTPVILHALRDAGLLHHAYRMLQSRDSPSWLHPVLLGATTVWERWDSMLPDGSINPGKMTSFNHYALGSVASFMHAVIGGLSPLEPGWKKALIRPEPGGSVVFASAQYLSPYGLYSCEWSIEESQLHLRISVPPNGSAEVVLGSLRETRGSGDWIFCVPFAADPRFPPKGKATAYGPQPSENWAP